MTEKELADMMFRPISYWESLVQEATEEYLHTIRKLGYTLGLRKGENGRIGFGVIPKGTKSGDTVHGMTIIEMDAETFRELFD